MNIEDLSRIPLRSWGRHQGNNNAKEELRNLVHAVRVLGRRAGFRLMFRGPSRSGKTSLIQYAAKCIGCFNLNFDTLDACHQCPNCIVEHHLYGNVGWENYADFCRPGQVITPIYYRYVSIDCTTITAVELDDTIRQIDSQRNIVVIVYLDEIHRLARRQMDERLLTATDRQDVIWIGSSVRLNELDEMLLNRFRIVNMQKPNVPALGRFLAEVCQEFGVKVESPESTLITLAEQSHQVTGTALQVLNCAYQLPEKLLTRAMVDHYVYRLDD
jgi:hypothetical protein